MITTEAWVLHRGSPGESGPAELKQERFSFPDITECEVLAEPIYGSWEGNMTHALARDPVDVCRQRCEEKVVLGNAGVVRVLKAGASVKGLKEGDLCAISPIGTWDEQGYMLTVYGYDARHSVGVLAKRVKLHEKQAVRLPDNTRHSLRQWAAFPIRYGSAWANWGVAYGCWRTQMSPEDFPVPFVWGWGGGVSLAELSLAKFSGCRVAMIASSDQRLRQIEALGIQPIDRRQFPGLDFDEGRYRSDRAYLRSYLEAEGRFLEVVRENTLGRGVSIFIENIGRPVFRATLKALSRQGVITTQGWKRGMELPIARAAECVARHIHVHTHGGRHSDALAAMRFAEEKGWVPPVDDEVYGWDDIPRLAEEYAQGRVTTYFPVFQVNPP